MCSQNFNFLLGKGSTIFYQRIYSIKIISSFSCEMCGDNADYRIRDKYIWVCSEALEAWRQTTLFPQVWCYSVFCQTVKLGGKNGHVMEVEVMVNIASRMHGRCKMAAVPASDAARWGDERGTPLPARRTASRFFFSFPDSRRLAPIRLQRAPNRTDSRRFGPNRIVSAEYQRVSAVKRKLAGEKKKKNLKPKIPMDLIRHCRHLHWP